jgi:hypothetical protein
MIKIRTTLFLLVLISITKSSIIQGHSNGFFLYLKFHNNLNIYEGFNYFFKDCMYNHLKSLENDCSRYLFCKGNRLLTLNWYVISLLVSDDVVQLKWRLRQILQLCSNGAIQVLTASFLLLCNKNKNKSFTVRVVLYLIKTKNTVQMLIRLLVCSQTQIEPLTVLFIKNSNFVISIINKHI